MTEPFILRRETQIAAPRATVFAYLTDPDKILSWMGTEAATEPHAGGLYLVKGIGGSGNTARGRFREVVPVHRLAYSFGWDAGEEVPPGSSLIEIDLIEQDGGTLLRMTHSGLPNAEQVASHDKGWAHYLGRLTMAAAGRDPGPDPNRSQGKM
ncbi:SRPBCC family protein [Bradyrhizobium sp. CB1650]|uniref:SRPBCC family protein n=1 Tax=Bradyrhizobium sp. CB1650 TaxID=3039153 RepID=UPI0024355834|nr:SRPBCC family protein [Bradyrhizobium sp. CB1650]WGD52587.1 SRPBCC family protein [Bradyrhizobium sp. CB1650]